MPTVPLSNPATIGLRAALGAAAVWAAALSPTGAAAQPAGFAQCIARIEALAVDSGVRPQTAREVLATVEPLERVITADRNQPEFIESFGDYLGRRVTPDRVARGRDLLATHRELLSDLTARYGVPGRYVVALWGLETDYGRVLGNVPVFNALATLACDDRRPEYFTDELIGALEIADRGDVHHSAMIGSWAGAMGQTQFMPSAYLAHAADGDGDGRVDVWNSVPDALASAARLLRDLGWRTGLRWGREVRLPDGFDYFLAGLDNERPLTEWRDLGLTDTAGRPVPALDIDASVLVPSGSRGPAFLVYENFRVIMAWNNSQSFALSVGHLADRIAGGGQLTVAPFDGPPMTREQLMAVQRGLNERGHDAGAPDGILGPATRNAIREFQRTRGWAADGFPTPELLEALGAAD